MMNSETQLKTKILIIGKGVSGLTLSYLLEKKGVAFILLERETKTPNLPLAETIPPSTLNLLNDIGLLNLFEDCASRTYGYQSKWYNEEIIDESFFLQNPFKYGLKLNKQKLLSELSNDLKTTSISYKHLLNIQYKNDKVLTSIKKDKEITHIESDFIIDATGRKRALLNKFSIPTKVFDTNLAFVCYVPKTTLDLKYGFVTESFENGWGTVSNLNETTNIISLYSNKDSSIHKKMNVFSNWKRILSKTSILKNHLPNKGNFKVFGKQANSSTVDKIFYNNCLAIGDAAIAFDPISSHGISNALFCANEASKTIDTFYKTQKKEVFNHYEKKMYRIFYEYLKQKDNLYQIKNKQPL